MTKKMIHRLSRPICCFAIFLLVAPQALGGPADQLREIGDSIRHPSTARLVELANSVQDVSELPDIDVALKTAAIVYAFSTGDPEQIKLATDAFAESDRNTFCQLDDLKKLGPINLSIDPMSISSEAMIIVSEIRQSIVEATMIGNTSRVQGQLKELKETGLPETIDAAMTQYANDAIVVAKCVRPSPLKIAVNISSAAELQDAITVDRSYAELAAYIKASPEERESMARSREGKTSSYDVMKEVITQQPKLVEALSKIREQYWAGEYKRAQAIIEMQKAIGNSLDLKMKRMVIYWQMKELRQQKMAGERESSLQRNLELTNQYQNRTFEDVSPVWPSLFQHRELRQAADQLLTEIRSYSPSNCGALSICYARSKIQLRKLDRTLANNLNGLTIQQRAMLRIYLRELEEEIQSPFNADGPLYTLATKRNDSSPDAFAESRSKSSEVMTENQDVPVVNVILSGDKREIASFVVYQSVLRTIIQTGADRNELKAIAEGIRKSSLLTKKHRDSLNQIGSKIYRGQIDLAKLSELDDPVSTLARIAGVVDDGDLGEGLPDNMREEAFEILISDVTRRPSVN